MFILHSILTGSSVKDHQDNVINSGASDISSKSHVPAKTTLENAAVADKAEKPLSGAPNSCNSSSGGKRPPVNSVNNAAGSKEVAVKPVGSDKSLAVVTASSAVSAPTVTTTAQSTVTPEASVTSSAK
jgi:hypothetical protein